MFRLNSELINQSIFALLRDDVNDWECDFAEWSAGRLNEKLMGNNVEWGGSDRIWGTIPVVVCRDGNGCENSWSTPGVLNLFGPLTSLRFWWNLQIPSQKKCFSIHKIEIIYLVNNNFFILEAINYFAAYIRRWMNS